MSEDLLGYRGESLELLREAGVKVGDFIKITRGDLVIEGILMPRSAFGDDKHIEIKLKNGYNIGLRISQNIKIEKIEEGAKPSFRLELKAPKKENLPKVKLIGTGGTIASRIDYRTGAVKPALSASDLYSLIPELADIALIETEVLFNILSENMEPSYWSEIARRVYSHLNSDISGVVIAHGTDTMAYTASALSFAIQNLPVPIVLVGSQRSSDRPSSDASLNLIGAVIASIKAPFAEVVVAMHETTSDNGVAIHRGVRVRKFHTSRRDAFKSIGIPPVAVVRSNEVYLNISGYFPRDHKRKPVLKPEFNEKVALLKYHPGFNPAVIDWFVDNGYQALIFEGTGLGHVGTKCFNSVKRAIDEGVFIGMTSQCIFGRVNMNVYETGRELLSLGVTPLEDMLPEVALVKAMWVTAQTKDLDKIRELMLTNMCGEITSRRTI